ncbi:hypothetical protein ACK85E_005051, partial [Salmonella enterica]
LSRLRLQHHRRIIFAQSIREVNMWNPEENGNIEDAAISARSLNELLDLMYISFKTMSPLQTERLLGLALNISSDISVWMDEEEKRREKQHY